MAIDSIVYTFITPAEQTRIMEPECNPSPNITPSRIKRVGEQMEYQLQWLDFGQMKDQYRCCPAACMTFDTYERLPDMPHPGTQVKVLPASF